MSKECWSCKDGYPINTTYRNDETMCSQCLKIVPGTLVSKHDKECDREMSEALANGTMNVSAYMSSHGEGKNWSDGKIIHQLPPGHPDRVVTSESQARNVAQKHGINEETGQFKSNRYKEAMWSPENTRAHFGNRRSIAPGKGFGGKIDPKKS